MAVDALGNVGETDVQWTVDVGPPKVQIRGGPSRFTTDTVVRFRLWSKTDPALFLCSYDGSPQAPCEQTNDVGPLVDGSHKMTVWGLDAALNVSAPISYRFTVDTIPPGMILSGVPDDGVTTPDRTTAFDVWLSEPGQLFCSLDGSVASPCSSPVNYRDLGDGPHVFEVYAQDRAGNRSIVVSRSWTIDPNAPPP
jgi:hypothetical protein